MPGNFLLRPARPEEAGALSSLAFAAKRHWGYPDAWMQAWRESLTVTAEEVGRDRYLVAEREGRLVGFAAVSYAEGRAELDHCWVDPLSIGRGIGRALLTAAYRQCVADGWTQLLIEADPNSVAFYYKLGARPVGEVESTPTGRRLPLFLMQHSEVMLAEPGLSGHWLGMVDYRATWRTMQRFTDCRSDQTGDEMWFLEHPPVFTQGQAGKPEHLLRRDGIPLVASDRGGQITYHGPGQLVVYPLLDLTRRKLGVRDLVRRLEQSLIDLLADFDIEAYGRVDAPGVYVGEAKIASLGLRIRHGRSYHGLALNVAMDLAPFSQINPCGYSGMAITQLADFGIEATPYSLAPKLADKINALLAADGSATLSDYALSTQPKPEKNQP